MDSRISGRLPTWEKVLSIVSLALGVYCPHFALAQDTLSQAFSRLAGDTQVAREITFSDIGINGPLVLDDKNQRKDIDLPVPAGTAIKEATLHLAGSYSIGAAGGKEFIVSIDDNAVAATAFAQGKGDVRIKIGVDDTPRAGGFVRLTLALTPAAASQAGGSNTVTILPTSRFTFRADSSSINSVAKAWSSLPNNPVIVVADRKISAASYDTAWRIGVALARSGKHPAMRSFPSIGDEVSLQDIDIPNALRSIPAVRSFVGKQSIRIENDAQVGALLALKEKGASSGNILIMDAALHEKAVQALNALKAQVLTESPDAEAAFNEWQGKANGFSGVAINGGELTLARLAWQPVIAIGARAGGALSTLLANVRQEKAGAAVHLQEVSPVSSDAETALVPIARLGAIPGNLELSDRAEWQANFRLGEVAYGRLPSELVLDVSAAPPAAVSTTLVSVSMNGVLLGSKHLKANGNSEKLTMRIPRYALGVSNVIKVTFQRQAWFERNERKKETVRASVLPTSYMVFEKGKVDDDFIGMVVQLGRGAQLLVPNAYLDNAPTSLDRVIAIASAAHVIPDNASFLAVTPGSVTRPAGPFLSFDLPLPVEKTKSRIVDGQLVLPAHAWRAGGDFESMSRIGLAEVNRVAGQPGVVYRGLNAAEVEFHKPFQFERGDMAVVGDEGLITEIDSDGASGGRLIVNDQKNWVERMFWWLFPVACLTLFILLLLGASHMHRRKLAQSKEGFA